MKRLILPLLLPIVAHAQVGCSELLVDSLAYTAFTPGLQVVIHNNSTEFISYPMCDLLDADGDTLIHAQAQTFGVIEGTSQPHTMAMPFPAVYSPFTGTVVLHYVTSTGDSTCHFAFNEVDLCPPEPCSELVVYTYGVGSPVNASMIWTVTDNDQNEVATGGLQLNEVLPPTAMEGLCLPPGLYTLHITQPFNSGEAILVGLGSSAQAYDGPYDQTDDDGNITLPFAHYLYCLDGAQSVTGVPPSAPLLIVDGRTVRVSMPNGKSLGALEVLDTMGCVVHRTHSNGSTATITLDTTAPGAFILRTLNSANAWPAQRFILN